MSNTTKQKLPVSPLQEVKCLKEKSHRNSENDLRVIIEDDIDRDIDDRIGTGHPLDQSVTLQYGLVLPIEKLSENKPDKTGIGHPLGQSMPSQ